MNKLLVLFVTLTCPLCGAILLYVVVALRLFPIINLDTTKTKLFFFKLPRFMDTPVVDEDGVKRGTTRSIDVVPVIQ